ncbi:MAG TPA: phospholipase D-like domain-containing protein, partial [Elusimicrobiales bacterium]|nr:phospholipase D-like domain-containing protein [Elusimicrobiales bacterium]
DGMLVETGSFNWLFNNEKENSENIMFLGDKPTVRAYQEYFKFMWGKSHPIGKDSFYTGELPELQGLYSPAMSERAISFNGADLPAASFSPSGGTGANIVAAINAASRSVDVAVFSINLYAIVDALIAAHKRGVRVRVVTDYMQATGPSQAPGTKKMLESGIEIYVNDGHTDVNGDGNMHHKFGIFDGKLLQNGSFNWSFGAEARNFENSIFTTDKQVVAVFKKEFSKIFNSAREINLKTLERVAQSQEGKPNSQDRAMPRPPSGN